jgi:serine/threonine protein kinase
VWELHQVADFGLSKVSVTGNTLNSKVGSLNWCAPEILLQSMPYTDKADVYSFGMVLWELLTHEAPFSGMHPLQIVRAIDQVYFSLLPFSSPALPSTPHLVGGLRRSTGAR